MPKLNRDGVALSYEEAGSGGRPFVFIHGWCCDLTYFAPQADYFSRANRTISVDLRGHGQSDKPVQAYTIAAFADDIAWICGQLGVEQPVIIGHSMGGLIAFDVAARYPNLPSAVVDVDSPIFPAEPLIPAITQVAAGLQTPNYREVAQSFVSEALFIPADDPDRKAKIVAGMSAAPQQVMASAFANIATWDASAVVGACRVPALDIAATVPLSDLARFQAACPQLVHGQTVGAGHFNQLEVPDQVNGMIERFLRLNGLI